MQLVGRFPLLFLLFVGLSTASRDHPDARSLLLYKISEEKSIYIIDKMRKVSLDQIDSQPSNTFNEDSSDLADQEYNLLYSNDDFMLVGGLDSLFNISLDDLNNKMARNLSIESSLVPSFSTLQSLNDCHMKKSTPFYNPYKCGNYVKVAVPVLNNSILITCSTNKLSPICASRLFGSDEDEETFVNVPPHSLLQTPSSVENSRRQNVAPFVYADSIYYFYVSDKTSDGIFKQNFVPSEDGSIQFTELVNVQSPALLNPNFRSSYGYKDKVYFFFSELDTSENSDVLFKTPTSFVGEICADDNGRKSYNYGIARFLTFKKTVINCYLPDFTDKIHIKYNEIQQVTKPISSNSSDIFYAIFTLRRANSIDSALCQYKTSSVESSMRGLFKYNPDKKPLHPYSSCSDYKSLTSEEIDSYYRGINTNNKYQMEQTINSRALFALNSAKFTSLAVDSSLGQHVIYIGLDNGRLLKIITTPSTIVGHSQPVIVTEYEMFANQVPINNIIVSARAGRVVALSNRAIKSIGVDAVCPRLGSCRKCVESQDPYCSWSGSECVYFKNLGTKSEEKCDETDDDQSSIESNLVYTINDYKLAKHLAVSSDNQSKRSSTPIGLTVMFIILASIATSILSVYLTCWFIKRHYDVRNKSASGLLLQAHHHHGSSSSSSSSSFNKRLQYFNPDRLVKFLNRYYFIGNIDSVSSSQASPPNAPPRNIKIDLAKLEQRQKIINCYEIATSAAVKKDNLKPVTVVTCSTRPNSSNSHSESPYTNTTGSSSLEESNSNSPNNASDHTSYLGPKYVSINDTSLSSSDEMIARKFVNSDEVTNVTSSLLINKSVDRR